MNLLFQRLKQGETSGQIVVLVVLFLAVTVVFVAIAINLGKIAQLKTLVAIAADNAAIGLASAAGSYALALRNNVLSGKEVDCEPAKWIKELFNFLVAVLLYFIPGVGPILSFAFIFSVMSGVYVLFQQIADQHYINVAYNKQMQDMTESIRFTESAIRSALFGVTSDTKMHFDDHDLDMDGLVSDQVSRFAEMYADWLYGYTQHSYVLLGNQLTYSWQDNLGWHHVFVKVEHYPYPTIYAGTSWVEECRRLVPKCDGKRGYGRARVTVVRYDQNRQYWLSFAAGRGLWRFLFTHPAKGEYSGWREFLSGCVCGGADGGYFADICPSDPYAGFDCSGVTDDLERGVKSESCASWGPNAQYIKPIPCSDYDLGC